MRDLFYSDSWQLLEERATSGGTSVPGVQYVWSPVYVDALVLRDRDTNGDGTLDERLYVAQDANYNITALFDTSGNLVERYAYDPYGVATILAPDWSLRAASLFAWQHLHQGLRFEPLTGLYHNRAREYSPALMRFVQMDPVGFAAGYSNAYIYVGNLPTSLTDTLGLEADALKAVKELAAQNREFLAKFKKDNPTDSRLLFLDVQQEILANLATNKHFMSDPKAAEWLARVLRVFMGSLNNALENKIAPAAILNEKGGIQNPKEYATGVVDFIHGRKAGAWWAVAFKDAKKICEVLEWKKILSPTSAEVYAIIMAQAHIEYDLYNAIRFEGVGTDKDWAEIGKVVAEASQKFQLNQKQMAEIGAQLLGGPFDIQKIRNEMRQRVIKELERNWAFDAIKNPYEGKKAEILEYWIKSSK